MSSVPFAALAPPPGPPDPRFASAGLACGSAGAAGKTARALAKALRVKGEWLHWAGGIPCRHAVVRRLDLRPGPDWLRAGVAAEYDRTAGRAGDGGTPGGLARAALARLTAEPGPEDDGVRVSLDTEDGRCWSLFRAPVCRTEDGQADLAEFRFWSGRPAGWFERRRPAGWEPERGLPAELAAGWRGGGPAAISVSWASRRTPDGTERPRAVSAADPVACDAALRSAPYDCVRLTGPWRTVAPHAMPALRAVAARTDLETATATVRLRLARRDGVFDARLAELSGAFGRPRATRTAGSADERNGFLAAPLCGPWLPEKNFDPFVRPAGDAAVRLPLFKRRHYQLDVLHRAAGRAGGPVLDLQTSDRRGRAAARLARVLASLDRETFPFEPWAGDPWGRWE